MRKAVVIGLALLASVVLAAGVMAEGGVKDECVALCKEAAKFINEKGFYPAVAVINNKDGKFVTKNTYVFMMDMEGHLLAHPFNSIHRQGYYRRRNDGNCSTGIHAIAKTKGRMMIL
jgi:hypothetical protein